MQQPEVKCDYFVWRDPEMCVYGQRVLSRLRKWHDSLKVDREQSGTKISAEVGKYKTEAERCKIEAERSKNEADKCRNEVEKYKSKVDKQKKKIRAVERKYQFALLCSWMIFMLYLWFNRDSPTSRMMLH
jgi:predicted RNase H-like nuclease (RuvC/YqgF family)